jgi:hypothetical protein
MDKTMFFPFKVIIIPDLTRKKWYVTSKKQTRILVAGASGNLSNDSPGVSIAILPQVQSRGFFLFGSCKCSLRHCCQAHWAVISL